MSFRWTKQETEFLKQNHKKMTYKKIGEHIGKNEDQVYRRCKRLGLNNRWEPWEITFLEENYKLMSNAEIADCLGRKESSVKGKKYSLGLSMSRDELAFLKLVSCQREHGFLEASK